MYDIFRDEWISGYRVTAFPFKENILVNIQYFRPGSSLARDPAWEFTVYLLREDEEKLRQYPTTIIQGLVSSYHRRRNAE